jgi:hypothetical protein
VKNKYRLPLIIIALFMVLSTAGVIFIEIKNPGFCPPYPFIGLPACMVMIVYFLFMLLSLFVKERKLSKYLFYILGIIALISAIVFSVKEIMDLSQCPRLFDIPLPLCFTVVPMLVLLLYLKMKGELK